MDCAENHLPPRIRTARGLPAHWLLGAVVLLGLAGVVFLFNPQQHGFYPFCLFHQTTGLLCPGCGCLRATHELLHGHVAAAFRLNPLYILALPIAGFFAARALWRWRTGRPVPPVSSSAVWIATTVFLVFGILRNVPGIRDWAF